MLEALGWVIAIWAGAHALAFTVRLVARLWITLGEVSQ